MLFRSPVPSVTPAGGVCHLAALTRDVNGNYTDVSQAVECQCTTATCGAGMVNAAAALAQALHPLASFTTSTDRASVGERITLDGAASSAANGATIAAYQWTANPDVSIANADKAVATLVFPALRPVIVTLRVTDNLGRQDVASQTINSVALSAGGGSGALGPATLAALGLVAIAAFLRRAGTSLAMLRGRPRPRAPGKCRRTV